MGDATTSRAAYKRIIVCADGTWNASNVGDASVPSNVAKIARAVASTGQNSNGDLVPQTVFYNAGLGSGDLPLQKAIFGGLGWGLDDDVCQLYSSICLNYEPEDELFFFGFSRGAFTVRSVAGLVCDVGVLSAVKTSEFADMWKAYRANTDGRSFRESEWYAKNEKKLGLRDVQVKLVGVWDTVGALGIPQWQSVQWLQRMGISINKKYAFHNTKVSKSMDIREELCTCPNTDHLFADIDYAFQALAIDEHRVTFPPTVWHKTPVGPAKQLLQCWFPGVHGDIGGFGQVGYITLAWMIDNVSDMLTFEQGAIEALLEGHRNTLQYSPAPDGWGCGPIENNFSGLTGKFFWLLGYQDRTPGNYGKDPGDGEHGETIEAVHPVARNRKNKIQSYPGRPLKYYNVQRASAAVGWEWTKAGIKPLPEHVMKKNVVRIAYQANGKTMFRDEASLSRRMCPPSILSQLDIDNSTSPTAN